MASNENEFGRKLKQFITNRAVIVTVVTLLVATGIIIAATVSANRAKKPTQDGIDTTGTATQGADTQASPTGRDEVTLPTYNAGETKPVAADPEEPEAMLCPLSVRCTRGTIPPSRSIPIPWVTTAFTWVWTLRPRPRRLFMPPLTERCRRSGMTL